MGLQSAHANDSGGRDSWHFARNHKRSNLEPIRCTRSKLEIFSEFYFEAARSMTDSRAGALIVK